MNKIQRKTTMKTFTETLIENDKIIEEKAKLAKKIVEEAIQNDYEVHYLSSYEILKDIRHSLINYPSLVKPLDFVCDYCYTQLFDFTNEGFSDYYKNLYFASGEVKYGCPGCGYIIVP